MSARFNKIAAMFARKLHHHFQGTAVGRSWGESQTASFTKFASYDPSHQRVENQRYAYLSWLATAVLKENIRAEDVAAVGRDLRLYDSFKAELGKKGIVLHDLNADRLSEVVKPYRDAEDEEEYRKRDHVADRKKADAETEFFYEGPEGKLLSPKTMFAAQFWGRGTKWCVSATKSDNHFESYNEDGPIFIFLPAGTSKKFAFHGNENEIRNARDKAVHLPCGRVYELIALAMDSPKGPALAEALKGSEFFRVGQVHITGLVQSLKEQMAQPSCPDFLFESILKLPAQKDFRNLQEEAFKVPGLFESWATYDRLNDYLEDLSNRGESDERVYERIFSMADPERAASLLQVAHHFSRDHEGEKIIVSPEIIAREDLYDTWEVLLNVDEVLTNFGHLEKAWESQCNTYGTAYVGFVAVRLGKSERWLEYIHAKAAKGELPIELNNQLAEDEFSLMIGHHTVAEHLLRAFGPAIIDLYPQERQGNFRRVMEVRDNPALLLELDTAECTYEVCKIAVEQDPTLLAEVPIRLIKEFQETWRPAYESLPEGPDKAGLSRYFVQQAIAAPEAAGDRPATGEASKTGPGPGKTRQPQ